MATVIQTFERIHKRKPTDEELTKIYEMAAALDANENDTFLSLIVALDFYHGVISTAPEKINAAVNESAKNAEKIAQQKTDALLQSAIKSASTAIADAAKSAARAASIRSAAVAIGTGVVLAALVISVGVWKAHKAGVEAGIEIGKAEQRDDELLLKSAGTWAETETGQKAYKLHELGQLEKILGCTGRGWKIEKGEGGERLCFPMPDDGQVWGWELP